MMMNRREMLAKSSLAAAAAMMPPTVVLDASLAAPGPDPLGVRQDFPIVANGRTFLDSAYITPCPRPVVAAGAAFLEAKASRALSVGELLTKTGAVADQFAQFINASPEEVGFVFATTEGENLAANNIPFNSGDNVVVDSLHYEGAHVVYRELERRRGVELRIVEDREGLVTPADIARRVDARTRLVSVSYVSSVNGLRHDVRAIADIAHAHGALLHVDAIQALGMFPVDVRADDMDFLCAGTYKWLLAGFGGAPFYIRRSLLQRIGTDRFGIFQVASETPDRHFQLKTNARRYDYATLPFAEIHQLGAGLDYLKRVGVGRIETHTLGLARQFEKGVLDQGHKLFTPAGNKSSVVCFYTKQPQAAVRAAFNNAKIDVTVRENHVRVSFALFNTADDVDAALAVTKTLT
jgi:selenocysteine lyase/cysteine desulfurase